MFELKRLHKEAVPAAYAKAERYRFLHEPGAAESICRDILVVEPDHQDALVMLILCLTDQLPAAGSAATLLTQARELVPRLKDAYARIYYQGIICERWGKAQLHRRGPGSAAMAYEWLREAMGWYEKADASHPASNDDPILRWNSCARVIAAHRLEAAGDDHGTPPFLE